MYPLIYGKGSRKIHDIFLEILSTRANIRVVCFYTSNGSKFESFGTLLMNKIKTGPQHVNRKR